jgi:hypothetical protein
MSSSQLVRDALIVFQDLNKTKTVEIIFDSVNDKDTIAEWKKAEDFQHPLFRLNNVLLLEDGTRVQLDTCARPTILRDRSGVMVISNESDAKHGLRHFEAPNNAAIYNADGTLRFQLISPEQGKNWYIEYTGENPRDGQFGFFLSNGVDPDLHFCAYDGTAKLSKILFTKERR